MQQPLPNASAVLALGIISFVGCCCYGLPGVVCAIIALVLYSKDIQLYSANPDMYTASSYSNLRTGRICAIIGLIPSILYILFVLFIIFTAGIGALTHPDEFIRQFQR
ncbi:MAG: hypothetical protein C5B52_06030 [Bacteroidetes bacterium]|nr:MAG: hypothetical protein C5B52_06030 [Bacteroidota bacterium]